MTNQTTNITSPPGDDTLARMETLLSQLSNLQAQNNALQTELNEKRILEHVVAVARSLRMPETVIATDLPRYLPDFVMKDGKVVARLDETQDATNVLKTLQKQRPHWQPVTCGGESYQPPRPVNTAINYAAEVERQSKEWFD